MVSGGKRSASFKLKKSTGFRTVVFLSQNECMPRRSIWKGSFVDAFLLKMRSNREESCCRKIWSRRSSIPPEFVDRFVQIYNGKTFVRCKITEAKVGHKFGEFALVRGRRKKAAPSGTGLLYRKGKRKAPPR